MPEARVPSARAWHFEPAAVRRRLVTAGTLLWFTVLTLFPLGALVKEALSEGWGAFHTLAASADARHAFVLTLVATVASVVVNGVFGLVLALLLARYEFPGKSLLDALLDMPFAVSPVVAGFMLLLLLGPKGFLGRLFEAAGVHVVFAIPGIVLATLFVSLPFVVREVVPVLKEVGIEQEEAAETLGAGPWLTFRRVTFPAIRWGLAYGVSLTAARALGEFGAVLVVSGNIIGRTQTATLFINQEFADFHFDGAYCAALVLAVVSVLLLLGMELGKRLGKGSIQIAPKTRGRKNRNAILKSPPESAASGGSDSGAGGTPAA
jgi:sulfate/thiosulfate transport system permease protein